MNFYRIALHGSNAHTVVNHKQRFCLAVRNTFSFLLEEYNYEILHLLFLLFNSLKWSHYTFLQQDYEFRLEWKGLESSGNIACVWFLLQHCRLTCISLIYMENSLVVLLMEILFKWFSTKSYIDLYLSKHKQEQASRESSLCTFHQLKELAAKTFYMHMARS